MSVVKRTLKSRKEEGKKERKNGMKNDNKQSPTVVLEQSPKLRRAKSREVSSRFRSASSLSSSIDAGNWSPVQALSPVRRKPEARKNRPSQLDGLWPSSSPSSSANTVDTLADHLGYDRLNDILERNRTLTRDRQRSYSRSELVDRDTKENHRPILGGSMRYAENPRFSAKSSSLSSASRVFNSSELAQGRLSVDEKALLSAKPSRRMSDNFAGASEIGEACSSAYSRAKKHGIEVESKYMSDVGAARHRSGTSDSNISVAAAAAAQKAIKRANSLTMGYGSSKSQWALSPGRAESPRLSVESKGVLPVSFSNMKPPSSPSRTRRVEKLLNLGLDFFKSKRSSSSSSSSSPVSASNSTPIGTYGSATISETSQEFRLLYNRQMQWRFVNAKADFVNAKVANQVEGNLVYAWNSLTKLQYSVAQKKIQLHKEKLEMRLNSIIQSQLKLLEGWGDMERQHTAAISSAKESLHSVVCKVPLIEGAKVDIQSALTTFRHALDLASSIKSMLKTLSLPAEKNVELLSELAKVVVQEKLLLEECLELLREISILEIKERSLKCGITQMEFCQQQQKQKHGQEISS